MVKISTLQKDRSKKYVNKKPKQKRFKSELKEGSKANAPSNSIEISGNWKKFLENRKNEVTNKPKQEIGKKINKRRKIPKEQGKNILPRTKDDTISALSKEIWFDDVDTNLLEKECGIKCKNLNLQPGSEKNVIQDEPQKDDKQEANVTRYVALDCEMVGIGHDGKENALARVSLVNSLGQCIYDKFVKPIEKVVDYRTAVSGVRPSDLKDADDYQTVQKEVSDILKGRILVGHALQNDLKVLLLSHSRRQVRDTSKYKPFRQMLKTKRPALRKLAAEILGKQIQSGEHSSVIDAQVTMEIYQRYKKDWERSLRICDRDEKRGNGKEIFVGNAEAKKKGKMNKWNKIKQRKKSKE